MGNLQTYSGCENDDRYSDESLLPFPFAAEYPDDLLKLYFLIIKAKSLFLVIVSNNSIN